MAAKALMKSLLLFRRVFKAASLATLVPPSTRFAAVAPLDSEKEQELGTLATKQFTF